MSLAAKLPLSPVAAAFPGIRWEALSTQLRLTNDERNLLEKADAYPIEYTLTDAKDTIAYTRILMKVLSEASGPSGPSLKVSLVNSPLTNAEAMQMLYTDPVGVVMHYVIYRLHHVVVSLKEKKDKSTVNIATTFYLDHGSLMDEWKTLLRVLHLGGNGDGYAQGGSALCLAEILMSGCPSQRKSTSTKKINYSSVEEPIQALVSWIASELQSSTSTSLSLIIPTVTALMNCPETRVIFSSSGGIGYLCRHLRTKQLSSSANKVTSKRANLNGTTGQQVYELCFCLWTMTYECNSSASVRQHFARDGVVEALVNLISSGPREKVIRVALSALRNLAVCSVDSSPSLPGKKEINGSVFLSDMIGGGLMKQVTYLKQRQWADPDIIEDVDALYNLLHTNYHEMSRLDLYMAEVESGQLQWGILHTDKFFRGNAKMMEGPKGDFSIIKVLIALLSSTDDDIAAIACYDIGEFVRFYPNGRSVVKHLGAKEIVMQLIDHPNADVQRHALQCVSKIMVQNWKSVG